MGFDRDLYRFLFRMRQSQLFERKKDNPTPPTVL